MKYIVLVMMMCISLPTKANYVWNTLVCGDKFVQLIDTNSTDGVYAGMNVDDKFYNEDLELSHDVTDGKANTLMSAKDMGAGKMVAIKHFGSTHVTAYIEYNINENGQIVGEHTYGARCHTQ